MKESGSNMTREKIGTIVSIICMIIGAAMDLVGMSTNEWEKREVMQNNSTESLTLGLWKRCNDTGCHDREDAWLGVCRAFGIIGILLMVACSGVEIVSLFLEDRKVYFYIATILNAAGVICMVVEFSEYLVKSDVETLGYSFIMTILAFVMAVVGMVCFAVANWDKLRSLPCKHEYVVN